MKVIRIRNASSRTPTASPKPIERAIVISAQMKPEKTEAMNSAAAATTRAPEVKPSRIAVRASLPWTYASCMPETRNIW